MSVPVCRYFKMNSCRYGDRCRFSHESNDDYCDSENDGYCLSQLDGEESRYLPKKSCHVYVIHDDRDRQDGFGVSYDNVIHKSSHFPKIVDHTDRTLNARFGDGSRHKSLAYSSSGSNSASSGRSTVKFDDDVRRKSLSGHRHVEVKANARFDDGIRHRHGSDRRAGDETEGHSSTEGSSSSYDTVREVMRQIRLEAKQSKSPLVERENMWPLTSLSVLKDGTTIPGWEDLSPEELRLAAYSAKASDQFQKYIDYSKTLLHKAEKNRNIFLNSSAKAEKIVWTMLENLKPKEKVRSRQDSPAPSDFHAETAAFSAFGSSSFPRFGSSETHVVFGTTGSVFGLKPLENDPAPGIFASAALGYNSPDNRWKDSVMDTGKDLPTTAESEKLLSIPGSIFGGAPLPPIFPTPKPTLNSLGNAGSTSVRSNIFGCPSSMSDEFHDDAVYTPVKELSDSDLEQFLAPKFTLDKLPLVPPPKELC